MTFGQYAKECELFELSAEYYDMMKEALEIDLMDAHIIQQQYIREYNENIDVSDNYLVENVNDEEFTLLIEAANKKKSNLLNKVKSGLISILKTIRNFFRAILKKFHITDEEKKDIIGVVTQVNNSALSDDKKTKLSNWADKVMNKVEKFCGDHRNILVIGGIAFTVPTAAAAANKFKKLFNMASTAVNASNMTAALMAMAIDDNGVKYLQTNTKILDINTLSSLKDELDSLVDDLSMEKTPSLNKLLGYGSQSTYMLRIMNQEQASEFIELLNDSIDKLEDIDYGITMDESPMKKAYENVVDQFKEFKVLAATTMNVYNELYNILNGLTKDMTELKKYLNGDNSNNKSGDKKGATSQ